MLFSTLHVIITHATAYQFIELLLMHQKLLCFVLRILAVIQMTYTRYLKAILVFFRCFNSIQHHTALFIQYIQRFTGLCYWLDVSVRTDDILQILSDKRINNTIITSKKPSSCSVCAFGFISEICSTSPCNIKNLLWSRSTPSSFNSLVTTI